MADPILYLACAVITLAGVPGMLLYTGGTWSRSAPDVALLFGLWLVVGAVAGVTGALPGGFAILVPVLGLVAGTGVAAALAERIQARGIRAMLLAGFSLLIFVPLALVVFGGGGTWLYREVGSLDFAGALPAAIGAGGFLTVVALASGRSAAGERVLALRGAMLVAVAAVACAVGLELRIDELTPAIALHMLMTPAIAILAAAGIERVKRGRNTREGLGAGTLAGTAAALATSAYLETVSALILGLLAGAVAEAAFRGASAAWRLATPLLIGGITGMLFLGIFGLDVGFVYSGQPMLLARQALVVGVSLIYTAIVSLALVVPLRGRFRR
ncbi:MAG: ammonium transporter [Cryobacterium sp.]|nr:ammonium transporter [Cryobacterium sp.]